MYSIYPIQLSYGYSEIDNHHSAHVIYIKLVINFLDPHQAKPDAVTVGSEDCCLPILFHLEKKMKL